MDKRHKMLQTFQPDTDPAYTRGKSRWIVVFGVKGRKKNIETRFTYIRGTWSEI